MNELRGQALKILTRLLGACHVIQTIELTPYITEIMEAVRSEIEKAGLTDDEMDEVLCPYEEITNKRHRAIARAQQAHILKILEEK